MTECHHPDLQFSMSKSRVLCPTCDRVWRVHNDGDAEIEKLRAENEKLEDDLNRQKAKTEYEAELRGNCENDLDAAKAEIAELRAALRKVYHLGPRPWINGNVTEADWNAAMGEAERLLGYEQKAGDSK